MRPALPPPSSNHRKRPARRWALALIAGLALPFVSAVHAADDGKSGRSWTLVDETDQFLDLSDFLDKAYGFIPIVSPITEPAVGYGAAAALLFVDRQAPTESLAHPRPNITLVGGLATENGTRGLFAGQFGNWREDRLRTLVGVLDAEVHLQFFGLGGGLPEGERTVGYALEARGGAGGGSYRFGSRPVWLGLRFSAVATRVEPSESTEPLSPAIPPEDRNLDLAALTPTITLDTRDNLFTPTRGWYLDLSVPVYREALGGDRDFERATLTGIHFRPLSESLFFGARATANASSDGTPFFLRPYVHLRGVEALRYQGERTAELEAELRWQLHRRFSLVGFGGAGAARTDPQTGARDQSVVTGGLGGRYLVARTYGMHMGLDVAFGPDDPIVYVIFGSAWARP